MKHVAYCDESEVHTSLLLVLLLVIKIIRVLGHAGVCVFQDSGLRDVRRQLKMG